MATIKSYSDLQQSRKLSEILPLETADQIWQRIAIAGANLDVPDEQQYIHNGDMPFCFCSGIAVPCWSLAALLGVLPKIHKLKPILDLEENSIQYSGTDLYIVADELIDACYEMIIKLYKMNLL